MRLAICYFTPNGRKIMEEIVEQAENLKAEIFVYTKENSSLRNFVEEAFLKVDGIIFIGAAGIAVRLISPYIKTKASDPAVLVVDELGKFVVPLLSGHIGGANQLAIKVADMLKATPVITTATDINGLFAVDTWAVNAKCAIANLDRVKGISAALIRGDAVGIATDFPIEGGLPQGVVAEYAEKPMNGIVISLSDNKQEFDKNINLVPKIVTLGVGCRKNITPEAFEQFILETLEEHAICILAVKQVTSIDLKENEPCILAFCAKYKLPFMTYCKKELLSVEGEFQSSAFVLRTVGVDNVCERSAMIGTDKKTMVMKKSESGYDTGHCCRKLEM